MTRIDATNVHFSYEPSSEVLRGVSISVPAGASMSIMGPNGSGKTTLVKMFNGLLLPTTGRVTVDDIDTKSTTISQLSKKVGVIFQSPEKNFFSETVRDEIAFGPKNMGFTADEVNAVVDDVSEKFGLRNYLTANPFDLSGGEKRRLSIASVLAWKPDVIVLDEPTIGLDYQYRVFLIDLIRDLRKEGKSIVTVTHDIDFALQTSERTALLSEGCVVWQGDVTSLLRSPEAFERANLIQTFLASLCHDLLESGAPERSFAPVDVGSLLGEV